jgi:hypothetical protein
MSKPIRGARRIRGVGVRLIVAIAVALALGAGSARADNPVLTGDVGLNDAFVISLSDAAGAKVTHLDAGTYTLVVHDRSSFHNFHLSGPGVNVQTAVDTTGDTTFTVTLVDGTYFFDCDPHSSQMKGSFTVGSVTAPPPPTPPTKLAATLSAASASTLGPLQAVAPGKFVVTVRDRSTKDGFRLAGPGVAKTTGARFTGTVTWAVTLRAGRYSYGSVELPKRRHVFIVAG